MNYSSKQFDFNFEDFKTNILDNAKPSTVSNVADNIYRSYLWVLVSVGVPGNALAIAAVLTMQVKSPATFFVALLAFFDGSSLIFKLVYHQLYLYNISFGDVGCKLEFLVIFLVTVANWMLVLICAERFISVCYPLKKVSMITKKRSYISAAVLSAFFFVFFGVIFIIMREQGQQQCTTTRDYVYFWQYTWLWINATSFLFLPFLFILILTVGIIRGLHVSRQERRSMLQKGSGRDDGCESSKRMNQRILAETERVERAITIMMILAALLFLVCALPACVYNLSESLSPTRRSTSIEAKAYWSLFQQIQHLMVDATHAFNFILYFIAARRFREQMYKLVTCKVCRKEMFKNKYQKTYSTQVSSSTKINHSVCPQTSTK